MARPRKSDIDLLISLYARMSALDRALARAAIQGAEAILSLNEGKRVTAISETTQEAFADLGARVAEGQ